MQPTTAQNVIIALFGLIGTFSVIYMFMKSVDKEPFNNQGFQYQNHKKDILIGILVGFMMMAIGFGTLVFLEQIKFATTIISGYELLLTGILFLLVAFMEETLLRGYILRNLMHICPNMVALLISATFFSLLHAANPNMGWISFLNLFLSGIVLGLPYLYTRNLWFPIALHFSWNFFQSLFGFNVSGQDAYSLIEITAIENHALHGGEFGFEGSILLMVLQVILILLLFIYFESTTEKGKHKSVFVKSIF